MLSTNSRYQRDIYLTIPRPALTSTSPRVEAGIDKPRRDNTPPSWSWKAHDHALNRTGIVIAHQPLLSVYASCPFATIAASKSTGLGVVLLVHELVRV